MRTSFRGRVLLLIIGMVSVAQLATIAAVLYVTTREALARTEDKLRVGEAVFHEDLSDQAVELANWVDVLTHDFAFREAVATRDRETIASVLTNHKGRVGATLALLLSTEGRVIAASEGSGEHPAELPLPDLLDRANVEGHAVGVVVYRGEPHHAVLMPVDAPLRVGWVCMGFLVDDEVATALRRKTMLDVSFYAKPPRGVEMFASTLAAEARAGVLDALRAGNDAATQQAPAMLGETDYLTYTVTLSGEGQTTVYALLQTPMWEALARQRELRAYLIALSAVALAAAVLGAVLLGRSVTRPVKSLAEAARRISSGDYYTAVEVPADRELGALALAFNDMQKRIAAREEQIVYQAAHDPLTNLYNRAVVGDRLTAAIARAQRACACVSVLVLDLDRFKEINDKLGHKIGDLVLQRAAETLLQHVRKSDTVLRLGGDEFLILLDNCDERSARLAAANFVSVLSHSIRLEQLQISLGLSIGISVFPQHGDRPEMLLRRADIALYTAKHEHSDVAVYEEGQDEHYLRQLEIINDLTAALSEDQFTLYFQPKVELRTREVRQVESLLRWNHPRHGSMRPDEFIPLAEKSGHIQQVSRWVVEAAAKQCRTWADRGLHISIAINLSALDLSDDSLPGVVARLIGRYGVEPGSLVFEVTETAIMANPSQAVRVLEELRKIGLRIALDDFGTGHSSLAQLKRVPCDELKIDKSFVLHLKDSSEDETIVRSTIDLGHNLGMEVVAEGVEDQHSWDLLESLGCDLAQGFFISQPMSAEEFDSWVEAYYGENQELRVLDAARARGG